MTSLHVRRPTAASLLRLRLPRRSGARYLGRSAIREPPNDRPVERSNTFGSEGPARQLSAFSPSLPEPSSRLGPQLLHGAGLLARVPLLLPRVGMHVVAVLFPESGRVHLQELKATHPLG